MSRAYWACVLVSGAVSCTAAVATWPETAVSPPTGVRAAGEARAHPPTRDEGSVAAPARAAFAAPVAAAPVAAASPSANATMAYDRDADVAARRDEAARELGPRTASEVLEGVFVIAAPGGRGELTSVRGVTERALAAYFNGRFARRPERAISVYLFASAGPYDAYCRDRWGESCTSIYGFYLRAERRIVMNVGLGVGTLTHELVHPIIETDFPGAPTWLDEGIASLFEAFALPAEGEIHGRKNWRHPRLLQALASPTEREAASLETLFGMSHETFRGPLEALNYATARYLCLWLDQRALLWPFYQRWRAHFAEDPTGEASFLAVVGESPAAANPAFARWVRGL